MNLCIPASPETEPMVKLPLLCVSQGLLRVPLPLGSKGGRAELLGHPLLLQRAGAPSCSCVSSHPCVSQDDGFRGEFCLPTKPAETAPRCLLGVAGI